MAVKLEWWSGSNGSLFADYENIRYCINTRTGSVEKGYEIYENGNQIARAPSVADAKVFLSRHV